MVYIQSDPERKLPHHFDAACALYGALDNAQEIRLTSIEEVVSGKFDALIGNSVFAGSVDFMTEVFRRIGKAPRVPKNSNRDERIWSLQAAIEAISSGQKLFIKPVQSKLFTGMVFDKISMSILSLFDKETEVIIAEPFGSEILSEWRCYIHLNQILDIRNYSGDQWILPRKEYVESIIKENSIFPDSYTIDVGILEGNTNVVIEFNDGWAIGNYGMDNGDYFRFLRTRYFQIVND